MAITLQEMAPLAGVSAATVSLVLNRKDKGRVGAARREQILEIARKHGYRPNISARGLVKGRHYRIGICWGGFLIPEAVPGQTIRYETLAFFARGFHSAGYAIELDEMDMKRPIDEISRELSENAVDGLILVGWPSELAGKTLFHLKVRRMPALASGIGLNDASLT